METEVWLPIGDFPDYEVSNLGRVRSNNPRGVPTKSPDGILRQSRHMFGYPMVQLYVNRKGKTLTVHGLVCTAFHGPKPTPRHEVAHEDGIPANVSAANLSWKLPGDNNADKIRHGTHLNSGQFQRSLSDDDVREIRRFLVAGMTQGEIAKRFGIWQTMVSHIKLGRRFAHVK